MKLYKIRDKKTGLFSMGGVYPRFTTKGKIWNGSGPIKSHLTQMKHYVKYYQSSNYYEDCEVVILELKEAGCMPINEFQSLKEKKAK